MQSDWNRIYKLTALKTGKDEALYKAVGNTVFRELYLLQRRPKSLIVKLRGIGTWFIRRKRMEIVVKLFPPNFDKKPEDFTHRLAVIEQENKIEIYNIFLERLKDYDEYLKIKKEVKEKRHETQYLLEPKRETD